MVQYECTDVVVGAGGDVFDSAAIPLPQLEVVRSKKSSGSSSADGVSVEKKNPQRYKTELCRPFEESGSCRYGDKCQFAHGIDDLRTLEKHPKFKTESCRTFHSQGFCPYGPRCHFVHNEDDEKLSELREQVKLELQQRRLSERILACTPPSPPVTPQLAPDISVACPRSRITPRKPLLSAPQLMSIQQKFRRSPIIAQAATGMLSPPVQQMSSSRYLASLSENRQPPPCRDLFCPTSVIAAHPDQTPLWLRENNRENVPVAPLMSLTMTNLPRSGALHQTDVLLPAAAGSVPLLQSTRLQRTPHPQRVRSGLNGHRQENVCHARQLSADPVTQTQLQSCHTVATDWRFRSCTFPELCDLPKGTTDVINGLLAIDAAGQQPSIGAHAQAAMSPQPEEQSSWARMFMDFIGLGRNAALDEHLATNDDAK